MGKLLLTLLMLATLVIGIIASCNFNVGAQAETEPNVYVGIDISYGDVPEAKAMIDQVSGYTNLFCVGTTRITWYPQSLTDTFQYAYDKGMYLMSIPTGFFFDSERQQWYANTNSTFGDKLLGFYWMDEVGGKQLDKRDSALTSDNSSWEAASEDFVHQLSFRVGNSQTEKYGYKAYTSDYGLYWFDYKVFDTVFAEFGWNYSRLINIATCRGAAEAQNKDWGMIITWTYTQPPYIESGEELYNDMVLAYDNGAKYILIFDGNEGWTGGILQQEHLDAIQRFWTYQQTHPPKTTPKSERTAFVLPKDYGFGFRGPNDHIWGLWAPDEFAYNMSVTVSSLIEQYGDNLDIIYDDGLASGNNGYQQLLYWDTYTSASTPQPTTESDEPLTANGHSTLLIVAAVILFATTALTVVFIAYQRKQNKPNKPKTA